MNRFASGAAIAALTLLASVPALPASAQTAPVTLGVADIDPLPGGRIDVTGDGADCPADSSGAAGRFVVTLSYTAPTSDVLTVVGNGAIAADGTFSTSLTLPETAVSDEPASIIASSTCSDVTTASNRVTLSVLYHPGTFALSAPSVAAGRTVTASGTLCYGGEYVIVYGPAGDDPNGFTDGTSGVPASDRSFTATLTIPPTTRAGNYDVYALCPGTEFTALRLAVTAAAAPAASAAPTVTVTDVEAAEPSAAAATLGGGFNGTTGTTTGTSGGGTTPVATAPVAVEAEASFTG